MHGLTLCAASLMSLLVVVHCGSSETPSEATRCCMPDQWEGRQDSVYTEVFYGTGHIVHLTSDVAYDATNEREVYITNRTVNNAIVYNNKVLYLYQSNVVYNLNTLTGYCTKSPLTKSFAKRCVPAVSQVTDESLLYGNASNYLQATRHEYLTIGSSGNLLYGTVTITDNCIPIVERMHTYVNSELRTKATDFYDITTGISSEDVFDIPPECSNARRRRSEEMEKYNFA